ncbi:MAG: hypothetical protein DMD34_09460 [Gemmatimonadetes bacterium]|nr:MAG: hypothetical protein DMD34_09460 [Gemmatimonadota bacterium]
MRFPARLSIPDAVLKIARQLETAGYETWCVGGAIRDNLLGVENHDFDLTTAAPPAEVQRLFKRTVPVGIEHGTVAVLDRGNHAHEVTTFRKDIKTDGRHAVVEFGVSLMDDLARRDFTINAIAYHPIRHEWRDPFKGADDLEHKLIRSVGDANWRFQEDYLRILHPASRIPDFRQPDPRRADLHPARQEFRDPHRGVDALEPLVPHPLCRKLRQPLRVRLGGLERGGGRQAAPRPGPDHCSSGVRPGVAAHAAQVLQQGD